ncbi:hypothetical protein [Herbaspirillum huttiense]|uniref:hypothetical protein n=1 Tax=Herbaspirillum huttiense TaxID=863372 RepID=UPI0039AEF351
MALFELILRGFKGETDETDHLVLWVSAEMPEGLVKALLTKEGLYGPDGLVRAVGSIADVANTDQVDFVLPQGMADLKRKAEELVLSNDEQSLRSSTSKVDANQEVWENHRHLNEQQREALQALSLAFENATSVGALDVLVGDCASPDSINDVCDALNAVIN